MWNGIDLNSDTSTRPSLAMKQAMMDALLGDEQLGEDPTTRKLEERMAVILGKSAAMFFPSATMSNQIAILLHCDPGTEILGAHQSHVFTSEAGGAAFHAGAQTRMIVTGDGTFDGNDVRCGVRFANKPHATRTSLLLVENTMNGGGGTVWPLDKLDDVVMTARSVGVKSHLDGARLFNAAVSSCVDVTRLAQGFDTVTVCFSKGLGCATGAVLGFDNKDWPKVRMLKQVFGGAMRQSGILAAACLYALEHHVEQLAVDHANAQRLAKLLCDVVGVNVENPRPESNMVYFGIDENILSADSFVEATMKRGLRFSRIAENRFRAVTHRDVDKEQIELTFAIVGEIVAR